MKLVKIVLLGVLIGCLFFVISCGSDSGATGESGSVTMSVTDARPLLPVPVDNFFVEFSEVWVHKPGHGWMMLELVESPYTIDLLRFHDGATTELVPPVSLSAGKYTQVRFVLNQAWLNVSSGEEIETIPVEIPTEYLRTDKNFTIDLDPGSAIDLVVHFDLSTSIVVSGTESDPNYSLKPVLHLFGDPLNAAVIDGRIDSGSIGGSGQAIITVISNDSGETYTQVVVPESVESEPSSTSDFSIYWLVPNKSYTVEIDMGGDGTIDCTQFIDDNDTVEGEWIPLNDGKTIINGEGICSEPPSA